MFNETDDDDDKVNINSSYDAQDNENDHSRDEHVRETNSRLSSASKKNEGERSARMNNLFDDDQFSNEIRTKSPNSSDQNPKSVRLANEHQSLIDSVNHEEQPTVRDHSRSSFHINEMSNDGPQIDEQNFLKDSIDSNTDDHHQIVSSTDYHNHSKSPIPKTNDPITYHPSCQFRTDKNWLDLQFHPDKTDNKADNLETRKVKKPDELETEIDDPPGQIDQDVLDRVQGSIVGLALGDALGAHVEFRPYEYMQQNIVTKIEGGGTWGLEIGQFTDDASMALCLANSLLARQDFVPYDQLVRYKWWSKDGYMSSTGQCFDIGAATSQSIHVFQQRQKNFAKKHNIPVDQLDYLSDSELLSEFDVYCSDEEAAGNGALMRLAPVPLFFFRNKYAAIEFSGRSGQITHGDQKAYDACRFYGALIVAALRGFSKVQILAPNFYSKHKHWFGEEPLHDDILKIAQGSYKKKYGYQGGIRGKGYIVAALEAALWAFWSDKGSFETGALAAVNLGDDTDTTAAIYGQLAGAYYGYRNLPQSWLDQVYALKFMKKLSSWIVYEGEQWSNDRQNSFIR